MRIAFVGLGAMGLPIAQRLATARDVQLSIFDARPERLDSALGRCATSVADAARDADAIFTVLPADAHVESVAREVAAAARAGQWFVDLSTIGPASIARIADALAAKGVHTVSVSITRGTAAAKIGALALFVGGSGPLPKDLADAFGVIASEVITVGDVKAPKAVKIANNMIMGCLNVAMSEVLVLARRLGIDDDALVADLARGADSWALRNQIQKHVLTGDLGPGYFATVHMAKDVDLYIEMAAAAGVPSYLGAVLAGAYRGVIAMGHGDSYHPIVFRWVERTAAVEADEALPARRQVAAEVMTRGVAAVQVVADLDALALLRAVGVDPRRAAVYIASGSGGNDALSRSAEWLCGRDDAIDPAELVTSLDAAIDAARSVHVPATLLETARQCAVALSRSRKKNSTQLA